MQAITHINAADAVAAFYKAKAEEDARKAAIAVEEKKDKPKRAHKSGKRKTYWDRAQFIAWDGEGHNLPAHNEHGDSNHIYTYCANSEGDEIHAAAGLSTKALFEMMLDSADENPKAINVVYGGSYDMNMILRDLPKETLQNIVDSEGRDFTNYEFDGVGYGVRYVQRKYLSIVRYRNVNRLFVQTSGGKWKRDITASFVLWDVIGFFQGAFVQTIESWLGKEYADIELIREGKSKRNDFENASIDYIRKYNAAELRALVLLMGKLHDALDGMGLKLSRWDGAGAVAAGINNKHNTKEFIRAEKIPDEVQAACQHAYFGGRIEMGRYGKHNGKIYHYDINSAYPDGQRQLPQTSQGIWQHYDSVIAPIDHQDKPLLTCYLIEWDFNDELLFGPFPYRSEAQKKVLFPNAGINWVWKPELDAAMEVMGGGIKIIECWSWYPINDYRPYYFIDEYYNRRQWLVSETKKDGVLRGEEKVIKLGINSLYGKTAQRAGYNEETGRIPPFHNLAYAGWITSNTRAALWKAAMQKPHAIICMATDGIFSTEPLVLDCPREKIIGKWEATEHDGMVMVQSGFYYINDGGKWSGWSRGFDKVQKGPNYQAEMKAQLAQIESAWKDNIEEVFFPCTRFITLKTALVGGNWWPKWCSWYAMRTKEGVIGRRLKLTPRGTKRVPETGKAHLRLISTSPETNYTPDIISERYAIPWIADALDDDNVATEENDILND